MIALYAACSKKKSSVCEMPQNSITFSHSLTMVIITGQVIKRRKNTVPRIMGLLSTKGKASDAIGLKLLNLFSFE